MASFAWKVTLPSSIWASAWDVLTGAVPLGHDVIVYDGTGRHPAPLVAEMAARGRGSNVSFASVDGMLAQELTYAERTIWKREFYKLGLIGLFEQGQASGELRRFDNGAMAVILHHAVEGAIAELVRDPGFDTAAYARELATAFDLAIRA